ncbi:hypothetical protein Abr02nite_66450 [Paractinoplanes brasiliensis]|nr:hypothetical protein Abr02nite_66450 [Actinoplanes brasiliensis]
METAAKGLRALVQDQAFMELVENYTNDTEFVALCERLRNEALRARPSAAAS